MKNIFLVVMLMFSVSAFSQKKVENKAVDGGCGMCIFKDKKFDGCAMAVKIDGKIYKVEGVDKKEFGGMHTEDGYCKVMKKAQVSGEIKRGKFYAKNFKYITEETKKE